MNNEFTSSKSQTDWQRLDIMTDEDIDLSDCPEITECLKSLDNGGAYRIWSPYDYGDAAQKLISLLEQEGTKVK